MCVSLSVNKTATVREAQHHLAKLVKEVQAGEEIVLTKRGVKTAKIVPYESLTMHRGVMGIYFERSVPWASVWSRANHLARQKASRHICRTLDIVHLSLALELGAKDFLSFDDRQNVLARSLDLKTLTN
jgi:prevent-host-death family protein